MRADLVIARGDCDRLREDVRAAAQRTAAEEAAHAKTRARLATTQDDAAQLRAQIASMKAEV